MRSTFATVLLRPASLAFDSAGNLYESEGNGDSTLEIHAFANAEHLCTGVNMPAGLALDSRGFLCEADQGTDSVLKFAPDGTSTVIATLDSSADNAPVRPVVEADDNTYLSVITQAGGGTIYRYTPAAERTTFASEDTVVSFIFLVPS